MWTRGRHIWERLAITLVKNYLLISATDAKLLNQFNPPVPNDPTKVTMVEGKDLHQTIEMET